MILDMLLGGWLIVASLIGARDGLVRKLVSSAMTVVALILGHVFMRDAADLLVEAAGVDPTDAPMQGFLTIFLTIVLAQSLIYRLVTGPYRIGGVADRIGGGVMGVVQGVLFLSSFLFIMTMTGWPSRSMTRDSRIYRGIVNLSPQILDAVTTLGPEAVEGLKGMTTPEAPADAKKKLQGAAKRVPVSPFTRKADSLRNALRR